MAAMDFLTDRGFTAKPAGMRVRVSPASLLTDDVRQFIKRHRLELLAELSANHEGAQQMPWRVITGGKASPEWMAKRDQYLNHIMVCRSCYAPTGRHCPRGAELRATYDATPMEPRP